MNKRLAVLLAMLLTFGLVAAGCGGDDDGDDVDDTPPATIEEEPAVEDDAETTGDVDEAVQQAIDACEQQVEAAPQLSDDVKERLIDICTDAAEGDAEAVAEASREVCVAIVEDSVPDGPAREQALDACEQATPTQ